MVEHVHGVMTIIYLLQMPVRQQRAIVQESIESVCKALEPTLLAAEGIGVVLTDLDTGVRHINILKVIQVDKIIFFNVALRIWAFETFLKHCMVVLSHR
jgi:hypothetical protein